MSAPRDDNRVPIPAINMYSVEKASPGAFTGGTADSRGDHDGTNDPTTLFNVTGDVFVRVWGVCTTLLAGASATIEVGIAGNTAALIAQTTATDIDANEAWYDATPVALPADVLSNVTEFFVPNGANIIETIGTANITSGDMYYLCMWRPASDDGDVSAA